MELGELSAHRMAQDYTVSSASPTHFRVGLAYCRGTHALRLRSDCIAVTAGSQEAVNSIVLIGTQARKLQEKERQRLLC